MSFQFRFAALLELRRRERDEAGAAVGQADEAIRKIDAQRQALEAERQVMRGGSAAPRRGRVAVDSLLLAGRYDMQLEAQSQSLQQTRDQLLAELARRQQRLIDSEAEVKRFERLEEKDREAHQAELRRREQQEADEATGRREAIRRSRSQQR